MSKLLEGKTAIVLGVWNKWSIAYAIAQAFVREGANLLLTYQNERAKPTVEELGKELGATGFFPCEVQQQEDIDRMAESLKAAGHKLDVVVHSLAAAKHEDLNQPFVNTSREGFQLALDVSAYSLLAISKALSPLMTEGGAIMTLTYLGSTRVVTNYNIMGVAKAALEAEVRYLASELGPSNIRVNAISAGAIKTISARGIKDLGKMLEISAQRAPLRRNTDIAEVADTAVFLGSDLGRGVTGNVIYVDAGFHIMGLWLREQDAGGVVDRDAAFVFGDVIEVDSHDRPIGAQRELVGPFDDDDGALGENVLEAERFEIVQIADAIEVDVIDAHAAIVFVHQRERGAGDFVFFGRAAAAGDSFR